MKRRKGFTIIELLIVLAMMAMMVIGMTVTAFVGYKVYQYNTAPTPTPIAAPQTPGK